MEPTHASIGYKNCSKPEGYTPKGNLFELWIKVDSKELKINPYEYSELKRGDTWSKQLADWIFRKELKLGTYSTSQIPMECSSFTSGVESGMEGWHCVQKAESK